MKPDIDAIRKFYPIHKNILALCDYAEEVEKKADHLDESLDLAETTRKVMWKQIADLTAQLDEKDKTIKRLNEYTNDKIARHVEARFKNNETFPETVTAQLDESHRNLGTVCEQLEEAQKEIERLKDA